MFIAINIKRINVYLSENHVISAKRNAEINLTCLWTSSVVWLVPIREKWINPRCWNRQFYF